MSLHHLIYYTARQEVTPHLRFFWGSLNKEVIQVAHKEAMKSGEALYCRIDLILAAPLKLGPNFLNMVDLSNVCMHIWVLL